MTSSVGSLSQALAPATTETKKQFEHRVYPLLQQKFRATIDPLDQWGLTVVLPREELRNAILFLRDDASLAFDTLLDITAVDYLEFPGHDEARFSVVYLLKSHQFAAHRIRLKLRLEEEDLVAPSVHDLYKIANWQERETWDQYGIVFDGHPNLKRLLNHWEFQGHPLRKDYPAQRRQKMSINDPMTDQLEARLLANGFKLLDGVPSDSPALEETHMGKKA